MSIFGSIVSAIFGSKHAADVAPAPGATAAPPSSPGTTASAGATPTTGASPSSSTITPISREDVEAILKKLHDEQREDFDWRKSIVDLMKLLKLDSGLAARKQLAQELGYSGALDGSAEMNCVIRRKSATDSDAIRPPIPTEVGHPFR